MIQTKRLRLAPPAMTPENIAKQASWLNDPEVVCYSEQRHKRHSIKTQTNYLTRFSQKRNGIQEIFCGEDLIGTISANMDEPNSVANIGILIGDRSKWGQGYGSEAWRGFCDYLLDHGVRKIEAGMMGANLGMVQICRKYEMEPEGIRPDHFLINKSLVDMVLFGKTR